MRFLLLLVAAVFAQKDPCASDCQNATRLCNRKNRGDPEGRMQCMAEVYETPEGSDQKRCAKCMMENKDAMKDVEKEGKDGDCFAVCTDEMASCKEHMSGEMDKMDKTRMMRCVMGAAQSMMEGDCYKCLADGKEDMTEFLGECKDGCVGSFIENGGCVMFSEEFDGESSDAMNFVSDSDECENLEACRHTAHMKCEGMCMSDDFDDSCCDNDSCDKDMEYCCKLSTVEDRQDAMRFYRACQDFMMQCDKDNGTDCMSGEENCPEGAGEKIYACTNNLAKAAGDEGKQCLMAGNKMWDKSPCGREAMACISDDQNGEEDRFACMVELAADRDDESCAVELFGDNKDIGRFCLKEMGACMGESKGKENRVSWGWGCAWERAFKGNNKKCVDAIESGGDGSEDGSGSMEGSGSEESEDKYEECERSCQPYFMNCIDDEGGRRRLEKSSFRRRVEHFRRRNIWSDLLGGDTDAVEDKAKDAWNWGADKGAEMLGMGGSGSGESGEGLQDWWNALTGGGSDEKEDGSDDGGLMKNIFGDWGEGSDETDSHGEGSSGGSDDSSMSSAEMQAVEDCEEAIEVCVEKRNMKNCRDEECADDEVDALINCTMEAAKRMKNRQCMASMKAMMEEESMGSGYGHGSNMGDECPKACAENFVASGLCFMFGQDSDESESYDWKSKMDSDVLEENMCETEACQMATMRLCRAECMAEKMDSSKCESIDSSDDMAYCCAMMKDDMEDPCADTYMDCWGKGMRGDDDMVNCLIQQAIDQENKECLNDVFSDSDEEEDNEMGLKCFDEMAKCMKKMGLSDHGKFGKCLWDMAMADGDEQCQEAMDDDDDSDDKDSSDMTSSEENEVVNCLINKSGKESECGMCLIKNMGKDQDEGGCSVEKKRCIEAGKTGKELHMCIVQAVRTTKNGDCLEDLREHIEKQGGECPMGCVQKGVDMGACKNWEKVDEMMMAAFLDGKDVLECMVEECSYKMAGECFGDCDTGCLDEWTAAGGCQVFSEKNEKSPFDWLPAKCEKEDLYSCEQDAGKKCHGMCKAMQNDSECNPKLCCGEGKPAESCFSEACMAMEYCCDIMEEHDMDKKECPADCGKRFKSAGLCDVYEEAGSMMADKGLRDCMMEECEYELATECFGECPKQCVPTFMRTGGCSLFMEDSGSESHDHSGTHDSSSDDGEALRFLDNDKSCLTDVCRFDAHYGCYMLCQDEDLEECKKCCEDDSDEICSSDTCMGMEYCCSMMEDDMAECKDEYMWCIKNMPCADEDACTEDEEMKLSKCMMEGARKSGNRDCLDVLAEEMSMPAECTKEFMGCLGKEEQYMGRCIFESMKRNNNAACSGEMMKEEEGGVALGEACYMEIGSCHAGGACKCDFDEKCFLEQAQKNGKCWAVVSAMGKDKADPVEFTLSSFKKENDCNKGKSKKAIKNGDSTMEYEFGCMLMSDGEEAYFQDMSCHEDMDGRLVFRIYDAKSGDCQGDNDEYIVTPGESNCYPEEDNNNINKGKDLFVNYQFEAPATCLPDMSNFWATYDGSLKQLDKYCGTSAETCEECGLKMKKGKCIGAKKMKCQKLSAEMCEKVGRGCEAKKGKCKGNFQKKD